MQLFNSLSQQIETFVARNDEVKLYVCGVTPYDTAHLGHAFVFATFDILVRYLRSQGLRVVYVENVTDIDDPLFERALELGNISWDQLAQQETDRFVREMHAIHVVMPDHFVRASEQLSTMFSLIERLLQSGNAYLHDGWIYFNVRSDAQFARLAFASGLMGYNQLLESANMKMKCLLLACTFARWQSSLVCTWTKPASSRGQLAHRALLTRCCQSSCM